jgi:outer membrane protein assembly factor BamB
VPDGTRLWEHAWQSRGTPSAITPIQHGGTLIVSSQGTGVAALRPARRGGAWSVDIVWETAEVSLFLSNPVLVDNALVGLSEKARGQYFALDADTGRVLWLGPPRQAENTAVVRSGRLLFLLNDDAELIVARSGPGGFERLARYAVATSATWAQPAVSGNRIFVKDVSSITLWTLE